MARSIWNGTITFGLMRVPIKVHSAVEDKGVHFHEVHAKDGAQVKHKRICAKEGKEVPYKQIAKGYEVRNGEFVLLSQDEIAAAAGRHSRDIELEEFVAAAEIDPVYYNRGYWLGAGDDGADAYRLLHDALQRADRVGLGRWVFHNREYLVAVKAHEGVVALHTMRFADELVGADDLDIPSPSRKPAPREVEMAGTLVDSLSDEFDPEQFEDGYRQRVLDLIEVKARGEEPELPEAPEPAGELDLAAALEASLGHGGGGNAKASRRRRSSSEGRRSTGRRRSASRSRR
ncbi:MAG: Ku protein [Solirubrobacteraceae bacterium]